MPGTAGEARRNSLAMFSHRCLHSLGRLSKTYSHQICADTGCLLEDLQRAMADRDGLRGRVKIIYAVSTSWCLVLDKSHVCVIRPCSNPHKIRMLILKRVRFIMLIENNHGLVCSTVQLLLVKSSLSGIWVKDMDRKYPGFVVSGHKSSLDIYLYKQQLKNDNQHYA